MDASKAEPAFGGIALSQTPEWVVRDLWNDRKISDQDYHNELSRRAKATSDQQTYIAVLEARVAELEATIPPSPETNMVGWQPIETAPVNGPNFIAWVIDRVDEYDEDDRLVARGKRVGSAVIAQCVSFTGGRGEVVEVPWKFVDRREYTHWMPLPAPPAATEGSADA